ncbi:MAG TPA: 23S rRNA (adenine(2503)-C(2))-methyltransferase RlmN [Verrucomicrobiota bacterium]|nr:23S rRNA (adenine(2503)-C(2))-methyltransferase RlmN [Verrucomicrobiales bacterium]HRI14446.1 23S rRNA (adenine(2503)-C(2))-methyltransferase RlmN [Verrucomicrobiota bacterium]
MLPDIRNVSREALAAQFAAWREPGYRLDQLLGWLYARRAAAWEEMTNLPKTLRQKLAATYRLALPEIVRVQGARDSTQKILWRLIDGSLIESVLIPANPALYGERSDRHTLCISTQVGCAYGCRFCASGLDGWKRNLEPHEIAGQVLAVERWNAGNVAADRSAPPTTDASVPAGSPSSRPTAPDRLVSNIVVMGMGEPLANYGNLMTALRTLNAPWGGGIGARKITISTSGIVPRIRDLADDPLQFRLAISLHGATDSVRTQIMPINRKYPLAELVSACEHYVARKGKMITFEYILIAGVNAGLDQVTPLGNLARRLHAKVNLIPYNTVDGLPWERPPEEECQAFTAALEAQGVTATLRLEKGHDIEAACGQLRLKTERELREVESESVERI